MRRRHWAAGIVFLLAQGLSSGFSPASAQAQAQAQALAEAPALADAPAVPAQREMPQAVNINTATAAELASALRGVGDNRAEAIVRYREQFGPFESVDELAEVSGIGSATLERNRDAIRIE